DAKKPFHGLFLEECSRGCPVDRWLNVVFGSGGGATLQAIDLGCFCVSTAEKEGDLSRVVPMAPYSRNADFDLFAGAGPLQLLDMASPCRSRCNWTDTNVTEEFCTTCTTKRRQDVRQTARHDERRRRSEQRRGTDTSRRHTDERTRSRHHGRPSADLDARREDRRGDVRGRPRQSSRTREADVLSRRRGGEGFRASSTNHHRDVERSSNCVLTKVLHLSELLQIAAQRKGERRKGHACLASGGRGRHGHTSRRSACFI
ncbi:unnamed protein product, partial [Symbiodinium sp. CCMP2456]